MIVQIDSFALATKYCLRNLSFKQRQQVLVQAFKCQMWTTKLEDEKKNDCEASNKSNGPDLQIIIPIVCYNHVYLLLIFYWISCK